MDLGSLGSVPRHRISITKEDGRKIERACAVQCACGSAEGKGSRDSRVPHHPGPVPPQDHDNNKADLWNRETHQ